MSYEVWGFQAQGKTGITRYNLAYINHAIHRGDNGRVLGFDNAHGHHHRHYMGNVGSAEFESFEATQERFQPEWLPLRPCVRLKLPGHYPTNSSVINMGGWTHTVAKLLPPLEWWEQRRLTLNSLGRRPWVDTYAPSPPPTGQRVDELRR